LGKNGKETVRKNFLLTNYLERYLDLFSAFEANYSLRKNKLH
jgi:hypothetical protein